jgi:peptide chain release factor 1
VATTRNRWFSNRWSSMRKWLRGWVFDVALIEERPGFVLVRVTGYGAWKALRHEGGGHRWQRVPPNERHGRVHTSTVTVAVLREPTPIEVKIPDRDLEWQAVRGSGAGGQARNKTSNAVLLRHLPTGILIRVETERSLKQNRETALGMLRARLLAAADEAAATARNGSRHNQVGSGMRGDKRRTYRGQDDNVTDHILGKRARLTRILDGWLSDLTG